MRALNLVSPLLDVALALTSTNSTYLTERELNDSTLLPVVLRFSRIFDTATVPFFLKTSTRADGTVTFGCMSTRSRIF